MKRILEKLGITPGPWIQGLFVDSKRFDCWTKEQKDRVIVDESKRIFTQDPKEPTYG